MSRAMAEVKMASKNQIVIPREAREALALKPGDTLAVVVRDGKFIVFAKPKSYRVALAGIGAGLYPPDHIQKERESWE